MKATDFFLKEIKDNNYSGINIANNINPTWQDDIFHDKKRNKEKFRKEGITNFVKELHQEIASKNLLELNISQITFDDEFEANKNQKIFDISGNNFENFKIYTKNIIGSFIYKSHHFNINCRFGNDFLQYMIANSSGFLELENFGAIDNKLGLGEWILIYYWKLQLKKAFSIGIYKTYKVKNANLSSIRGTIDINNYIKKSYFDGKTICNFKEHSYKNELNSIINLTLTKVFKSKYQSIVTDIYNIKNAFESINLDTININHINTQKVINPYFNRYNQVFDLSLKILKDEFANVGENNSKFSAFLFDISLLFEHHIRKLLKEKFELFKKNKKEFTVPNGIDENNVFPDIIIKLNAKKHGKPQIAIYDVKYKHFTHKGKHKGVNRDDLFQLITYISVYSNQYDITECGFIYPCNSSDYLEKEQMINKKQLLNIYKSIPFKIKLYKIDNQSKDNYKIKKQLEMDNEFISSF